MLLKIILPFDSNRWNTNLYNKTYQIVSIMGLNWFKLVIIVYAQLQIQLSYLHTTSTYSDPFNTCLIYLYYHAWYEVEAGFESVMYLL